MSDHTVTVTCKGSRFTSQFSQLPGKTFGPYGFVEMIRDLTIGALLSPLQARDLTMTARELGSATTEVGY